MIANIRTSNTIGIPAVILCISGSNVFRSTKITAPVTIAILYRGGSNAGVVLPKIGVNQNSRPVCFAAGLVFDHIFAFLDPFSQYFRVFPFCQILVVVEDSML